MAREVANGADGSGVVTKDHVRILTVHVIRAGQRPVGGIKSIGTGQSLSRDQGGGLVEIYVRGVPDRTWAEVLSAIVTEDYQLFTTSEDGTVRSLCVEDVPGLAVARVGGRWGGCRAG
jgi:hypothetical protein